jgi:branched-chain amino acid transport system ATP-binding protein
MDDADVAGAGGQPVLQVRDVKVRFGGVQALRGVSLEARHGQVVGVIGPNGAGKTTLFDVLSGLCRSVGGSVWFDGANVTGRSAVWRARWGMRRTFQRQQVFGRLTVEDNLLAATEWRGGGGTMAADIVHFPTRRAHEKRRRALAADVMELCGLTEVRSLTADVLPIATARLVELGRALMDQPKILLLDEPTSGLGAKDATVLRDVLARLRQSADCAVLLVEHDMKFVMSECDVIYVFATGSVLAHGTPAQIREHVGVRAAYLG